MLEFKTSRRVSRAVIRCYDQQAEFLVRCSNMLREKLGKSAVIGEGHKARVIRPIERVAYAIKSWNAYLAGRTIASLKFGAKEEFPEF